MHINIEFKAKCNDLDSIEKQLLTLQPLFVGIDHQIDTYFNTPVGRLKLREGNIENALIHYEREDFADAKQSNVLLYQHQPNATLKEILQKVLGVKVIVDKLRKIYFIDNVKFHLDTVTKLGTFIEVEAIDKDGNIGIKKLQEQCTYYKHFFGITATDLVNVSYSDLMLT